MLEKMKTSTFWLGIIGAIKLGTDAFGFKVIDDTQLNAIADGVAAIFTVLGVIISHDA
jgi:uncharacterized membrane protein